jgi:catechol 2,3-dioxygenase-like lactoylglutathione lyase family enzyme
MIPAQNNVLLELHVPDFEKVKDYYEKLGFEVVWERPPEGFKGYLVLKMGNNILCFWAGNQHVYEQLYFSKYPKDIKRGYGVEIVIMVDDVEDYYSRVKDLANVVEPLVLQPWGLKDFRTEDPFGYYLRITTHHNILDSKNAVK